MSLPRRFPIATVQAIGVAIWGACLGYFLTAVALAISLKTGGEPSATVHPGIIQVKMYEACSIVPWQEVYEKRMFIFNCLGCPVLAWLSVMFMSRDRGWACLVSLIVFVPAISWAYNTLFGGEPGVLPYLLAILSLAVPWIGWSWLAVLVRPLGSWLAVTLKIAQPMPDEEAATELEQVQTPGRESFGWHIRLGIALAVLLAFFFLPQKLGHYADSLAGNLHVCSWVVAPALYLLDPESLPGADFESHYGVGHAYVFSFFLGDSLHATLCNYVIFAFVILVGYFLGIYMVLSNFFRSAPSAFLATLVLAGVSMEAESYGYPSNWPLRFPFLFLFVGCAAQTEMLQTRWLPVMLAGFFAGLSLFWQTDSGVYLLVASVGYYGTLTVINWRAWWQLPLFFLAAAGVTIALLLATFGARAFSSLFFWRLLEPMFLYSGGFGSRLMSWNPGWSYLYNIVGPVAALASLGWAVVWFRSKNGREEIEARYLFLFGAIGLMMLFKWVNRSIDIVWSINATTIVVILIWWFRYAALALGEHLECRVTGGWKWRGMRVRALTGAAACFLLLGAALLATCFHDPDGIGPNYSSSPLVRIAKFTRVTPTTANKVCRTIGRIPGPCLDSIELDTDDVAFLRAHTQPTERVALISLQDWLYLADARRPPRFPLLPAFFVYSNNLVDIIESDVRKTHVLFVDRQSLSTLRELNPVLHDRVVPILRSDFELTGSSKNLDLYHRISINAKADSP